MVDWDGTACSIARAIIITVPKIGCYQNQVTRTGMVQLPKLVAKIGN